MLVRDYLHKYDLLKIGTNKKNIRIRIRYERKDTLGHIRLIKRNKPMREQYVHGIFMTFEE